MKRWSLPPWLLKVQWLIAFSLLIAYILWNAYHLIQMHVPPSMLIPLTGLPCPTTGGTRSLQCMLRGEWAESFRYHPFTIPIILLLVASFATVFWQRFRHGRMRLPVGFLWAWGILLSVSWIAKFVIGPSYW
jgi:hypothetical protein